MLVAVIGGMGFKYAMRDFFVHLALSIIVPVVNLIRVGICCHSCFQEPVPFYTSSIHFGVGILLFPRLQSIFLEFLMFVNSCSSISPEPSDLQPEPSPLRRRFNGTSVLSRPGAKHKERLI